MLHFSILALLVSTFLTTNPIPQLLWTTGVPSKRNVGINVVQAVRGIGNLEGYSTDITTGGRNRDGSRPRTGTEVVAEFEMDCAGAMASTRLKCRINSLSLAWLVGSRPMLAFELSVRVHVPEPLFPIHTAFTVATKLAVPDIW